MKNEFPRWAGVLNCRDVSDLNARQSHIIDLFFALKRIYVMSDLENRLKLEFALESIEILKQGANNILIEYCLMYDVFLKFNLLELVPYDESMENIKKETIDKGLKELLQNDSNVAMDSEVIGRNLGYIFDGYIIKYIRDCKPYSKFKDVTSAFNVCLANLHKEGHAPIIIFLSRNLLHDVATERLFTYNKVGPVRDTFGFYNDIPVIMLHGNNILIAADIAASFTVQVGYFGSQDKKIDLKINCIDEEEANNIFSKEPGRWTNSDGEHVSN